MICVAVDIGGTFTDLIGFDDERQAFAQAKTLTTPAELTGGVINCIRQSGLDAHNIDELIHGSTIAINTLIVSGNKEPMWAVFKEFFSVEDIRARAQAFFDDFATAARFVYRHAWRAGDLLMWDNRCLLHRADANFDAARHPRVLHHTCLRGTAPA